MASKKVKKNALQKNTPMFIVGVFLILISVGYHINKQSQVWFSATPEPSVYAVTNPANQPVRLSINSLSISLPITEAKIVQNKWEVSDNGVSHLNTSAVPQTDGNIILYGHNKTNVLGKITNLKKGDRITVTTRDRTLHYYQVDSTKVVSPHDTYILGSYGKEILTIYTCTGFADLQRFVVMAKPI